MALSNDPWMAVYRKSDGHLISMATVVADPLPDELAAKAVDAHRHGFQWNTALLDWEPKPARLPDIDRVDEFITRLPSGINRRGLDSIRDELISVLGDERYYHPEDSYTVGSS